MKFLAYTGAFCFAFAVSAGAGALASGLGLNAFVCGSVCSLAAVMTWDVSLGLINKFSGKGAH